MPVLPRVQGQFWHLAMGSSVGFSGVPLRSPLFGRLKGFPL